MAAAVAHPRGQWWQLWPVDHGFEIRADHRRGARSPRVSAQTVRLTEEAAMLNLRLAIAMAGHQPTVTPRTPLRCGCCRPSGSRRDLPPLERALFAAIATMSARTSLADHLVPDAVLYQASAAVEAEGAWPQ